MSSATNVHFYKVSIIYEAAYFPIVNVYTEA